MFYDVIPHAGAMRIARRLIRRIDGFSRCSKKNYGHSPCFSAASIYPKAIMHKI
jgi:hypothetical protein